MKSLPDQLWKVRWKGKVASYSLWGEVEDALCRGELSLVHEVEWDGRWWQIGEFLQRKPWVEEETGAVPPPVESVVDTTESENNTAVSGSHESFLEFLVALAGSVAWVVLALVGGRSSWALIALVAASVLPAFWLILKGSRKWPWYGMILLAGVAFCVIRATGWV